MASISGKDLARWLKRQIERDQKKRPRGQARGAIQYGPRAYKPCLTCTRLYREAGIPLVGRVGVPVQLASKHSRAHNNGEIRMPEVYSADPA